MNAMVKSTSRVLNIVCQMNEVIMFSVRDNHKRRCGSEVSTTCVSGRINESTSGPGAWLSLAALPPDGRKGFAFPIPIEEFRGSARIVRRSPLKSKVRKERAFPHISWLSHRTFSVKSVRSYRRIGRLLKKKKKSLEAFLCRDAKQLLAVSF